MTKQESAALNMAKFIRAQSLLLLEKLDVLNLDDEAADCERMHEQAEALYQKLSARFGIQGVSLDIENYCTVSLFFEQTYL